MNQKLLLTLLLLTFISFPTFSFFELSTFSSNSFSPSEEGSIELARRSGGGLRKTYTPNKTTNKSQEKKKEGTSETQNKSTNKSEEVKKETTSDKKINSKDSSSAQRNPSFFSRLFSMLPFLFLFSGIAGLFSFLGSGGIFGIVLLLIMGVAFYLIKFRK